MDGGTVRAIGLYEFGGPDVLREVEVPDPHPGPGEVRIRVMAAAVNPTDTLLRSGAQPERVEGLEPPYRPGMDVAGVIDELGPMTEQLGIGVGTEVMAIVIPFTRYGGGYAEYVVVPWESVAPIPPGIDFVSAATLPMNGLTAQATIDRLALPAGSVIAVTGAAGTYGGYMVQLAKVHDLVVIADASSQDRDLVSSFGADHVVERGSNVADNFRREYSGGVDGLADGAILGRSVLPAVRDGGRMVVLRGWREDSERGIEVLSVRVNKYALRRDRLCELGELAQKGLLTLRVAKTFPASEAREAHKMLEAGGVRGRLVLTF